jgi:hypothetical protein
MQHLELEPEETEGLFGNKKEVPTRSSRSSQHTTCVALWDRQSRIAKGFIALLIGVLVGSGITMISFESKAEEDYLQGIGHQKFHSGSNFGGINNIAQPGGAKAHAAGLGLANDEFFIPTSNLGYAVPSLGRENIINQYGHYIHDEHRSPYASHLYGGRTKEWLQEQQDIYMRKMQKVRETWGAWTDIDDGGSERPVADFTNISYKDMPNDEFPDRAWQVDEDYVGKLIPEAKALVKRVTEGIYAEYGYPFTKKDGTRISQEEQDAVRAKFNIQNIVPKTEEEGWKLDFNKKEGIGWLSQPAMDGLVRKLLHSFITNDEFYVVLAGHSAAAGHGNNFMQNKIITFHSLMEPVMDKLGIRLISRNMGMGGVGTLQFSLGGKMIYGEADIMLWDSGMTENGVTVDFFNKQAVLSGERMPVLMTAKQFDIAKETKGTAWVGDILLNKDILPVTQDEVQVDEMPYAVRFMNSKEAHMNNNEKFNAICWEDRSDFTPDTKQNELPGSQVEWHPGFRHHQYEGRLLALMLLEGLKKALDLWEEGVAKDGFPLAESYWHVGPAYEVVRENMRTHVNTEKEDGSARSPCETFIPHLPRICRVAMQGYGMWTPRLHNNFLDLVHPAPNGYKPTYPDKQQYTGFNLLPHSQAIPEGHVDVHAIAIATNNPAPDLDHEWIEESESNSTTVDTPPTRRWLREASEAGIKKGREHFGADSDKEEASPSDLSANDAAEKTALVASNSVDSANAGRELQEDAVIPGRGWVVTGWSLTDGYCDGSSMSTCGRNPGDQCLLYGTNDNHLGLTGNALSGWLVFTLPKIKEGIVLARMEWWCMGKPPLTKDWKEVNNGKTTDTTPDAVDASGRQLGKPTPDQIVPKDFEMDIAINGKITKTMDRAEWISFIGEASKNCAVWPLLNNEEMAKRENFEGEDMEFAIRFRSKIDPHMGFCISHAYYA